MASFTKENRGIRKCKTFFIPNGKTQGRYDTVLLWGWHLFLPFRLISRKHWYMLLAYQKAQIINTRFSFIPICSVLLFCRELCTELPGYVKQNKCGDVIMSCQQEQVRQSSVQTLSVSHLGWVWRCSVCPQAPLRSAAGLHHQSASAALQNKPGISMKGFSAQRKRKIQSFSLWRAEACCLPSLLFLSFFQLQYPYGRTEQLCFFGESPRVFQAAHSFF